MTKMPLDLTSCQSTAVCNQKLEQALPEHLPANAARKDHHKTDMHKEEAIGRLMRTNTAIGRSLRTSVAI